MNHPVRLLPPNHSKEQGDCQTGIKEDSRCSSRSFMLLPRSIQPRYPRALKVWHTNWCGCVCRLSLGILTAERHAFNLQKYNIRIQVRFHTFVEASRTQVAYAWLFTLHKLHISAGQATQSPSNRAARKWPP